MHKATVVAHSAARFYYLRVEHLRSYDTLDEREKPGFLLIGGGHLSSLSLSRVTEFCTATEKPV